MIIIGFYLIFAWSKCGEVRCSIFLSRVCVKNVLFFVYLLIFLLDAFCATRFLTICRAIFAENYKYFSGLCILLILCGVYLRRTSSTHSATVYTFDHFVVDLFRFCKIKEGRSIQSLPVLLLNVQIGRFQTNDMHYIVYLLPFKRTKTYTKATLRVTFHITKSCV